MLVCEEPTGSGWVASLYEQGTSEVLAKLFDVVLAREHEGVRLYQGIERGKQQTWLCTKSPERGWEILREMGDAEERKSPGPPWKADRGRGSAKGGNGAGGRM